MFYYCEDGKAIAWRCPNGYYFNPISQICDHTYNVDCTLCSPVGIQNLADPNDCRRHFRCVGGVRTHRWCSGGLVFDAKLGDCNVEAAAPCTANNYICAQFSHVPFMQFGNPMDCSKYYICLNGITFMESCAMNLYFNAYTGYCDIPGDFNFCQVFLGL